MRGKAIAWASVCLLFLSGPATLPAADADAVQRAIDRGVDYLKKLQRADGTWPRKEMGATALAGLTLLECGVAADDPAVQKAAAAVREASINETATYSLSLAIMFLDRLGDPRDVPFLESLTVKLLAGQNASGGWTYQCPPIPASEVNRLRTVLKQRNELTATTDLPKPGQRRDVKDLPREIRDQLDQINRGGGLGATPGPGVNPLPPGPGGLNPPPLPPPNRKPMPPGLPGGNPPLPAGNPPPGPPPPPGGGPLGISDNSNTQFAIFALWIGHRHGLPVERALAAVDARFRASQGPDGGWGYVPTPANLPALPGMAGMPGMGSTPAMTCAGLLGLALGNGSFNEAAGRGRGQVRDPGKDPNIKKGLLALGTALDAPADGKGPVLNARSNTTGYYFLWSLERVGVTYGLETIGKKDWYDWGANILLNNQGVDGSWSAEYAEGGCDTSFALLFLKRANLAKDLTAALKGKVTDPDQRELRTGGTSGADLKSKPVGLKPAFGDDKKKPDESADGRDKPAAGPGAEAGRLGNDLVRGSARQQQEALEKLRDTKGAAYTETLAEAIPKLNGDLKSKARDALADRLSRMTPATLAERLQDPDAEMRRAAALACGMKDDRTQVPRLIELLGDKEATVVRAAHAALKALAGKGVDYGPAADASPAEHTKAISAWKAWWAKEKAK
jgi:hypothetical protein